MVITAHVGLRDALLSLTAGHELSASHLWTQIAAQRSRRTRAELRTMAYYRGRDTVRAGVAKQIRAIIAALRTSRTQTTSL